MGISARNPIQALNAWKQAFRGPISGKELERKSTQFAVIKAKPDTVAAHRTWEGMRYLLEQVRSELGADNREVEVEIVCPQLLLQNAEYVSSFYAGNPFLPVITDQFLGRVMKEGKPDPSLPQAGVISFILVARNLNKGQDLIEILRGKKENKSCGIIGPTSPEIEVTEGKIKLHTERDEDGKTTVYGQENSLRVYTTINQGGELAYSKVFNGWHCSDSHVSAQIEVAKLYGRAGVTGVFDSDALDYILGRAVSRPMWRRVFGGEPVKAKINPIDVLRFPIYDLLVNPAIGAERRIPHAAEVVASFYPEIEYSPRDMQRPEIELMLQEAAIFAAETGAIAKGAAQSLWTQKQRTDIIVLVGPSGIGKTTHLAELAKQVDTVIPVHSNRAGAGDVGSTGVEAEDLFQRARQGRYVAAEGNYGVDYGLLTADLKRALLKGGTALMSCGPEMAKGLVDNINGVAKRMGLEDAGKEVRISVVYLQEEKEDKDGKIDVLKAHLEQREKTTGRPIGDRLKQAKSAAEYLRKHLTGKAGVEVVTVKQGDKPKDTLDAVIKTIQKITEADTLEVPDLASVPANSARVQLVLRKALRDLVAAVGKGKMMLDSANADTLEASIQTAIGPLFYTLLKEIFLAEHKRNPILPHENVTDDLAAKIIAGTSVLPEFKRVFWVINHIVLVVAAVLEGRRVPTQYAEEGLPRFGALYSATEKPRETANLAAIKRVYNSIPLEEELLMALLHDIGKLGKAGQGTEWPQEHERLTHMLLTGLRLADEFFPKAEDRQVFELVLKHHHLIGNCIQGAGSPALFAYELLADPAFVALASTKNPVPKKAGDDSERVAFVRRLLDRLLFFTISDVAGQGQMGYLANLRVEEYFRIKETIEEVLVNLGNQDIYQAMDVDNKDVDNKKWGQTTRQWLAEAGRIIKEISVEDNPSRLAALAIPLDTPEERADRGVLVHHLSGGEAKDRSAAALQDLYESYILPSKERAIDEGLFSATDWEGLEQAFPRMVFPYFDAYILATQPSAYRQEGMSFNPAALKFFVACSKIAAKLSADRPIEFVIIDKKGNPTTTGTNGQNKAFEALNLAFGTVTNEKEGYGVVVADKGTKQERKIRLDGKTGSVAAETIRDEDGYAVMKTIPLLDRGEKEVAIEQLPGLGSKIDFLVDRESQGDPDAERQIVYVRLEALELDAPKA